MNKKNSDWIYRRPYVNGVAKLSNFLGNVRNYFGDRNIFKVYNYFTESLSNAIRIPRRSYSKKGFCETTLINWHDSCYGNARKRIPILPVAKGIRFQYIAHVENKNIS